MEAYTIFAEIYDDFMDNIPYEEWSEYLDRILKDNGIDGGIVAELGCGTGSITRNMAVKGYDMIGIDMSEDMLAVAREYDNSEGILYICQDMRELELFGTVNAVISVCDSMNYILTKEDFVEVMRRVNNYLERDGLFIFDMKTKHFYKNILGDSVQVENRDDATLIWENHFDDETDIHSYDLTMFLAEDYDEDEIYENDTYEQEDTPKLYEKYQEEHYQRAYTRECIEEMIKEAGMELVAVYDQLTYNTPDEKCERMYFVVREGFQKDKYYKDL